MLSPCPGRSSPDPEKKKRLVTPRQDEFVALLFWVRVRGERREKSTYKSAFSRSTNTCTSAFTSIFNKRRLIT